MLETGSYSEKNSNFFLLITSTLWFRNIMSYITLDQLSLVLSSFQTELHKLWGKRLQDLHFISLSHSRSFIVNYFFPSFVMNTTRRNNFPLGNSAFYLPRVLNDKFDNFSTLTWERLTNEQQRGSHCWIAFIWMTALRDFEFRKL